MMKIRHWMIGAVGAMMLASCATPKNYNYLQDLQDGQQITTRTDGAIRLQPNDQITVLVKSKDPLMSALFNKGISTNLKAGSADGNLYMMGYVVGPNGCIDFPVVGDIKVEGLTRYEAEQAIKQKLQQDQLKDANVTVEFQNLTYTVTGEVKEPGVYPIEKDAITIFEALGKAGDISVYGKRDSVVVVRQEGNQRKAYSLSLNSAKDVLSSEAYYIRQNDLIYVKANNTKARQSLANGNETHSVSLWLSLASVLTTIAVVIFK